MRPVRIKRTKKEKPIPLTEYPNTLAEWEDKVFDEASGFTVVWKVGPGRVQRLDFLTFKDAVAAKGQDPRRLVYAVTAKGRSLCVSPKDFERYLKRERLKGKPTGGQMRLKPIKVWR